ncbi:MAG: chorismate mutase [Chitinophagales bacterium]|nr:chorismate mutase [Chitinophagales bacterium]MDW8272721.1 chorismate mutase [Chitinophagales bacterium]
MEDTATLQNNQAAIKSEMFADVVALSKWSGRTHKPFLIAGPCSAESEEQVVQTAELICKHVPEVCMLRAGIWKPRTRPNTFEGVGPVGLSWIKNAGKITGLPVCVEVANPLHVELSLKSGIDVLWIGARTTVSPFNVQEIAESLRGVDIPVLVKNPVNPDLDLWIGAMERFYRVGIKKIAAIHRGFSAYAKNIYRNQPMWEIPIELRRRYPQVPIIVDPSHMGGKRELIQPLSQQALNMGFEGLMIETHIRPDMAWSDAAQQITPGQLGEIMKQLVIRETLIQNDRFQKLYELRARIDRIDDYIVELLGERMGISEEIGSFKKEHRLAIHQAERWAYIVSRALENGKRLGLTEEFILKFFQQVHNESIRHQEKMMREETIE